MIKWFDSSMMTGLPVVTNTRGDLVTMLNALLVNGVNSKAVATVTYADGICTLEVGNDHGFIVNSVVDIQNSSQATLSGNDFKIKSVSSTKISFDCPSLVNNEIGLTVRYSPLGFEQYFASDGKACYKSPDPRYPAYLRVDDKTAFTVSDYHAKFAGVEICENMTDFDTATWQSPYAATYPLQNRQHTAHSTGWFKWYYAAKRLPKVDNTVPTSGNRRYVLVGDETYFWLIIYPYADAVDSDYGAVYGFALADYGSTIRQVLVATNGFGANDTARPNPHLCFVNVQNNGGGIAPFYGDLSSAHTLAPVYSVETDGKVVFAYKSTSTASDMLLRRAIYVRSTEIVSTFLGITTTDKNLTSSIVKTNGTSFKAANIGQSYCLTLDLE